MHNNQKGNFLPVLAVVILIITALISYHLGKLNNSPEISKAETPSDQANDQNYSTETTYRPFYGCNEESCLFQNLEFQNLEGFAKLQGYYNLYDSEEFGNKVTCKSLSITGGNENLIKEFEDTIKSGNTVNKIDAKGNLLVNINTENLNPEIKSLIESSNESNKLELSVIRPTPSHRGASTCTSFVEIITAQPLSE